ncbi:MAG TPA: hypothetical protein VFQ30_01860, partial [Ktedonobacteraceae bacterium]|nr:hypothetical protein [Ktedonobacteraceae bacterium]
VRVYLPKGVSQERTRYPFSSVLEVLGPVPQDVLASNQKAPLYLADLVKAMRRIRRHVSTHALALQCQEDALYSLGELCEMAGLSPQLLEDRLALAKLLQQHPGLFMQCRDPFEGEGLTLYGLAPEWRETLEEPEEFERPDQNWILSTIESYIGLPPDLYRRSVDPDTGAVVLYFHFPAVAQELYGEAIAGAVEDVGVPISIAPNAHQGALVAAARQYLPQGLLLQGTPSIYLDRMVVSLHCIGQTSEQELVQAQSRFYEKTGWYLEIEGAKVVGASGIVSSSLMPVAAPASADGSSEQVAEIEPLPLIETSPTMRQTPMNQHDAIQLAQRLLGKLPGFVKAGADMATGILLLRFHFPIAAQARYAGVLGELEARSGWQVSLNQTTNQQALADVARRLLPSGTACDGTPSILLNQQAVGVHYVGSASPEALQEAQQRFQEETGWRLDLISPNKKADNPNRLSQGEAMVLASEKFRQHSDFYRVGADGRKGILWLHFYFPDKAKQLYKEQLAELASSTGWRIYTYPYVHQKALVDAARRLFPEGIGVEGKAHIYEDSRTLHLTTTDSIDALAKEHIQQQFTEETGWTIDLHTPVDEYDISAVTYDQ